jgi:predicted lipoprotein
VTTRSRPLSFTRGRLIAIGAILVLLVAMFFGTKVVTGANATAADPSAFSASKFAKDKFASVIVPAIVKKATDVVTVSEAIAADPAAAAKKYGVVEGTSAPTYSVKFTGVAGVVEGGIMPVTVEGMPPDLAIRVQMGPAINGTALRDGSGTVHFPQFTNQIDYQDTGSELNNLVKTSVLAKVDAASLSGKSVTIVGVFQFINPTSYLITPVKIDEGK